MKDENDTHNNNHSQHNTRRSNHQS